MAPPSYLKPERLDLQPTDEDASKKFSHWLQTLNNFLELLDGTPNKLHLLQILVVIMLTHLLKKKLLLIMLLKY